MRWRSSFAIEHSISLFQLNFRWHFLTIRAVDALEGNRFVPLEVAMAFQEG